MSFPQPPPRSTSGLMALRPWATHYPIYQADAIPANLRRIPHQERLASFGGYRFSSIA